MLRGAFIGFGNVAQHGHLPGWQNNGNVVIAAAADTGPGRRELFLDACPDAHWSDNIDDLLSDDRLDFVDICTPPGSHAALIKKALAANLHVLCEKPLVTRLADTEFLADLPSGRIVHCVHNWLEAPICRKITELMRDGAVGPVRAIRWRTLRTKPAIAVPTEDASDNWRIDPAMAGGGILFDHGWHAIYCLCRWSGEKPRAVKAKLETRKFQEWPLEDTADIEMEFESSSGHVFLTWTADERANSIEIDGENGHIRVEGNRVVLSGTSVDADWSFPQSLAEGSHHPEWFDGVAQDFCTAIATHTEGNLAEALMCARVIDLAQRSSQRGGTRVEL